MKKRKVLVTGGAGFIGSSLAIWLKKKYPHWQIAALDNLKRRGSELNLARLKNSGVGFIHGDIRCPEDFPRASACDLLLECSAEPSVLAGYTDNPEYMVNTNFNGTVNCLEFARLHKAEVIFLSTSRVYPYGALNALKVKEKATRFEWAGSGNNACRGWSARGVDAHFTTDGPKTLYGATKLASELILQEYCAQYDMRAVINRCGVVAGPWQFGKVDQGVFTLWMLAHYFKRPLSYIGFKGKGKQVRDLLHVDDLCELVTIQIASMSKISGKVFNVGGGRQVSLSLLEATSLCQKITGNTISIKKELRMRPGDVAIYLTDNREVTRALGWAPRARPDDILRDTFAWMRKNDSQVRSFLR